MNGRQKRSAPLDRDDAEREADNVARSLGSRRGAVDELHDGPVPQSLRAPVERVMGEDLSHIRFDTHTDPFSVAGPDGLVAATAGDTVYTGLTHAMRGSPLADQVIAHELVHAAQFGPEAIHSKSSHRPSPLKLGFCGGSAKDKFQLLRSGKPLNAADAKSLIEAYGKLGDVDRDSVVNEFHKTGDANTGIQRLLTALDAAELEANRALVSDLLERVQRFAVEASAGKTVAQLGVVEGANMKAQAEAQALVDARVEAAKKGLPPPPTVSPADVAKAHDAETKKTSPVTTTVTNAWDDPKTDQPKWNARAAAVIAKLVAACAKVAPELHITAANLKWAPKEVAQEGSNVYAFSGNPISFGMNFVETAEANPDYCVRTVVHEIAGHPDYGDRYQSTEARVYAGAHTAEPSLGSPWDTKEEQNTFGYIGTEIYAALREVPYDVPLSAADTAKGLGSITIADNIDNKVGLVKSKFTAATAVALVQGLYERFRVDPRVTPAALAIYVAKVEKHFGKVLKI